MTAGALPPPPPDRIPILGPSVLVFSNELAQVDGLAAAEIEVSRQLNPEISFEPLLPSSEEAQDAVMARVRQLRREFNVRLSITAPGTAVSDDSGLEYHFRVYRRTYNALARTAPWIRP